MAKDEICTNCASIYSREESKAEHNEEFCSKGCEREFNELSDIDITVGQEVK